MIKDLETNIEFEKVVNFLRSQGLDTNDIAKVVGGIPKEEPEKAPDVLYLCDGGACDPCDKENCHHTRDINHAINFKPFNTGAQYPYYMEIFKSNDQQTREE